MKNPANTHTLTDALYRTNASYHAEKQCWEVTFPTSKGNIVHTFQTKPHWLDSMEKINAILSKHPSPIHLRYLVDTIESISLSSFDTARKHFTTNQLNNFLQGLPRQEDIEELEKIFSIKKKDEERSCAHHGSMASAHCATLFRLARVVDALKERKRTMRRYSFFCSTKTKEPSPKTSHSISP